MYCTKHSNQQRVIGLVLWFIIPSLSLFGSDQISGEGREQRESCQNGPGQGQAGSSLHFVRFSIMTLIPPRKAPSQISGNASDKVFKYLLKIARIDDYQVLLASGNVGEVFYYLENVQNIFIKYYLSRPCFRIFPLLSVVSEERKGSKCLN